jgi:cellulose synthase/poly-beta-1,6-N-acetylglucosamine synthase-like glycosyltransferase
MEAFTLITGILLTITGLAYAWLIGLFTSGWYWWKTPLKAGADKPSLKVSVIVAVRNGEKVIRDLLNDLLALQYPSSNMEVIIVDDHSTDGTALIIKERFSNPQFNGFRLLENPGKQGKKPALIAGINVSTGDIILCTDADCRVHPGWIRAMASPFYKEKIMMVSGPVYYFPAKGFLNRFQSMEFSGLVASGAGAALAGMPFMCNGANLAYRKSAFEKVNGYLGNNEYLSGDDVFLMHKIKKEFGSKSIAFIPEKEALILTSPAPGLKAFISQRIRWASKTKGYKDGLSTMTALTVFAFSFLNALSFFLGFYDPGFFRLFACAFLVKTFIDLPLMWGFTGFTGSRKLMIWYLPFQVVYPFYIVITGILSVFGREKW